MSLDVLAPPSFGRGKQSIAADGYEEVELDSSRVTTQPSMSNVEGEYDTVIVKLKFASSGTIELPMDTKECFEKTVG